MSSVSVHASANRSLSLNPALLPMKCDMQTSHSLPLRQKAVPEKEVFKSIEGWPFFI